MRRGRGHSGRTVLLSSHILAEVEALCDRVSIIRAGRTVESGTLAELRHLTRTSIMAELAKPPAGLDDLPGVHDLTVEDTRVTFEVDTAELDAALRHLTRSGSAAWSAPRRRWRSCSCATTRPTRHRSRGTGQPPGGGRR